MAPESRLEPQPEFIIRTEKSSYQARPELGVNLSPFGVLYIPRVSRGVLPGKNGPGSRGRGGSFGGSLLPTTSLRGGPMILLYTFLVFFLVAVKVLTDRRVAG